MVSEAKASTTLTFKPQLDLIRSQLNLFYGLSKSLDLIPFLCYAPPLWSSKIFVFQIRKSFQMSFLL
jgi:hypothetical protein